MFSSTEMHQCTSQHDHEWCIGFICTECRHHISMNKWQQYLFSSTEMHQCHSKDDSDWSIQELSPTIICLEANITPVVQMDLLPAIPLSA
jgi:hypothetical protein